MAHLVGLTGVKYGKRGTSINLIPRQENYNKAPPNKRGL